MRQVPNRALEPAADVEKSYVAAQARAAPAAPRRPAAAAPGAAAEQAQRQIEAGNNSEQQRANERAT